MTNDICAGLEALRHWLATHPDVPVRFVEHCEAEYAELVLDQDGEYPALVAAADTADALRDPRITVTEQFCGTHPEANIVVSGYADTWERRLEIGAAADISHEVRCALLRHIGSSEIGGPREWTVTAEDLRKIAAAAS